MFTLKNVRYRKLNGNYFCDIRLYRYRLYKISIGVLNKNIFFFNSFKLFNLLKSGFNLHNLKIAKGLKNLNFRMVLAFNLLTLIRDTGFKKKLNKVYLKKIRNNFFSNFNKFEKSNKLRFIQYFDFYFSKRWR